MTRIDTEDPDITYIKCICCKRMILVSFGDQIGRIIDETTNNYTNTDFMPYKCASCISNKKPHIYNISSYYRNTYTSEADHEVDSSFLKEFIDDILPGQYDDYITHRKNNDSSMSPHHLFTYDMILKYIRSKRDMKVRIREVTLINGKPFISHGTSYL